jgi:TusA-related sulfurtransferase
MSEILDAQGLSCPQPVLLVLDKMKELGQGRLEVLVDTETSLENVTRAAESQGWRVEAEARTGLGYRLSLVKP